MARTLTLLCFLCVIDHTRNRSIAFRSGPPRISFLGCFLCFLFSLVLSFDCAAVWRFDTPLWHHRYTACVGHDKEGLATGIWVLGIWD